MSDTLVGMYGLGVLIGILVVIFNKDNHGWLWKFSVIFLLAYIPERIAQWGRMLFGEKHSWSLAQFVVVSLVLIFTFPIGPIVYLMMNRDKSTQAHP